MDFKKYNYNLKNLFTIRIFIVIFFFYLFVSAIIEDYYYNLSNYWKEVNFIFDDKNIKDNSYVKINIEWFKYRLEGQWLLSHLSVNMKKKDGNQLFEETLAKKMIVENTIFKYLLIKTKSYNITRSILDWQIKVIKWKINKTNKWYTILTSDTYVPEKPWYVNFILLFLTIILFIYILFKDIYTLKYEYINEDFLEKINNLSYIKLLEKIKNTKDAWLYTTILLNKSIANAFTMYKRDLVFLKDIDFNKELFSEVNLSFRLKDKIKKLNNNHINIFFENEEQNIVLTNAYLMRKIFNNTKEFNKYINQNNEKIEQFERIITLNKWEWYIKKLLKDSNDIFDNWFKELFMKEWFKIDFLLVDNKYKELFYLLNISMIVYYRMLSEDKDLVTSILYTLNPLSLLMNKLNIKIK